MPAEELRDLGALREALEAGPVREALDALLSRGEVRATIARLDELLAAGRFPEPGPGRAVPVADRMSLRYLEVDTPLGEVTVVASPEGVIATLSEAERAAGALEGLERVADAAARRAPRDLGPVRRELDAYFAGTLRAFSVDVDLRSVGEGFARRALEAVRRIPYGEMRTYGDVADAAGSPRAGPGGRQRAAAMPGGDPRAVPPGRRRRARPRRLRRARGSQAVPVAARGRTLTGGSRRLCSHEAPVLPRPRPAGARGVRRRHHRPTPPRPAPPARSAS